MKINILFLILFFSIIVYASADFLTGIIGTTQLNGEGCLCHSLDSSPMVNVWIEGPDTVAQNETVQYAVYMEGGPSQFGGFNVASRFNELSPVDSTVNEIDGELTHSFPKPFPIAQPVIWVFNYSATTQGWDTLYSVGNSVDGDSIPDEEDQWNFGEKFPVFVTPPVPVELISFSANVSDAEVQLSWITASEINNMGFELEKSQSASGKQMWEKIGFVEGRGTTTAQQFYNFIDKNISAGKFQYRLKQIDFDGSYEYSNVVSVEFSMKSFSLLQNYPNPFNPETVIDFSIPDDGYLTLKIYNLQGELIDILLDGIVTSGAKSLRWDASFLPSGVYFYKAEFKNNSGLKFTEVKKMILTK